ncbi:MAG: DNA primase [Clostridia bacterium]|nr:DNA primase [Clostridia bacterium]
MAEYNPEELFQLSNGRYITSPEISKKMTYIKDVHPELPYQEDSTGYTWDEAGMADLFSECYQNDTRFCPEAKSWYTYEDGRWQKDVGSLLVSAKIKEFVRLMALYCGEIPDEEKRKQYMAFVAKMGDRRFRDRLMKDAADSMRIEATEFDKYPYLINCKNGTYDLKTMEFREHDWRDFLTMQTNFEYSLQDVRCERWEQFIKEVTQNDYNKADYLQRALGYSMLGESKEECMFILHGKTTRNGKSTLLDAIQHLLGDYATVAPVELICKSDRQKNTEAPTSVLARLKGRRFVTMSESDTSGKLDEATIKQYTGGEDITARELYQAAITFKPQFTMWLSCNDLPAVRDKSLFASDRVRVIEFNRHFTDAEQDKNLKSFFESPEAMKGIFTWLVAGFFKYKRFGLAMPDDMIVVIRQYEKDNDIVLQFLEEKCEQKEEAVSRAKTLYDNYKIWCKSNGYYVCSMKKFNAELTTHPEWYTEKGVSNGVAVYRGIAMKEA